MDPSDVMRKLETEKPRSAWNRGVVGYAMELMENFDDCGYDDDTLPEDPGKLEALLLDGARDWKEYSWGGCSEIYDRRIAKRLCTPSEFERTRGGQRRPNKDEEWLDVQARALFQACTMIESIVRRGV